MSIKQPKKAYVYQPLAFDTEGGKFYGVGGLYLFGLDLLSDESKVVGVTKSDAEEIARVVNSNPEFAANFIRGIKKKLNL